jgi:hypothetical protein
MGAKDAAEGVLILMFLNFLALLLLEMLLALWLVSV